MLLPGVPFCCRHPGPAADTRRGRERTRCHHGMLRDASRDRPAARVCGGPRTRWRSSSASFYPEGVTEGEWKELGRGARQDFEWLLGEWAETERAAGDVTPQRPHMPEVVSQAPRDMRDHPRPSRAPGRQPLCLERLPFLLPKSKSSHLSRPNPRSG